VIHSALLLQPTCRKNICLGKGKACFREVFGYKYLLQGIKEYFVQEGSYMFMLGYKFHFLWFVPVVFVSAMLALHYNCQYSANW